MPGEFAPVQDVMDMAVGEVSVQVRRTAPFTATEYARAASMADLVSDVLARLKLDAQPPGRRIGGGQVPSYDVVGHAVEAVVEGTVVGIGTLLAEGDEPAVRALRLRVDPAWRRRGIGTRLLVDAARLAGSLGVDEVVLTTDADNRAVLPMVLAAGLRGRIRMAADVLTVRVPVRDLKPLPR
ncbi:GNAT family N-acetyltransferase [Nocardioides sp. InS609-2]|uniref:GNAT family N-acetyltransferase n=1 Tax=Nocardioides sp. InS609-2 TaxID=2760705 RepID=UPI0020BD7E66|nr:GNAT family N-acetyltransferase [Nocardioides sp. InS609-2]